VRRRGGPAVIGLATLGAGWALGSTPLALAGLGLAAVGLLGRGWSVIVRRRVRLERALDEHVLTEEQELRYPVALRGATLLPGTFALRDRIGVVEVPAVPLRRRSSCVVVVPAMPRGIHQVGPGTLLADDPLGLTRVALPGPPGPVLRVRPRVVELAATFAEGGADGTGRGPRAVARTSGIEPHGVREYRDGESLRGVHWASSARRGRLMVRELEDPPHDDAVVVLDLDAGGEAGSVGHTSIDEAVRVAAALTYAHAVRGRRVGLVLAADRPLRLALSGTGSGWEDALDALAAATAVSGACTAALLRAGVREVRDGALVLVTARPVSVFAEALLRRGDAAAVVSIDAPTYAGAPWSSTEPALLRLAAHGVAVAVVRAGDDLHHVLSAPPIAAHA
jgi:uncharacterized protein (DUF58 family)